MKIYKVSKDGEFVNFKKESQVGKKVYTAKAVFGICFQINEKGENGGTEVELKIAAPTGAHMHGLTEINFLKDFFKIDNLDGMSVVTEVVEARSDDASSISNQNPPDDDDGGDKTGVLRDSVKQKIEQTPSSPSRTPSTPTPTRRNVYR